LNRRLKSRLVAIHAAASSSEWPMPTSWATNVKSQRPNAIAPNMKVW
jgi:hypothetical protein